jgi:nitrite reductase/ring-hydroxylating ferredoxin subunit
VDATFHRVLRSDECVAGPPGEPGFADVQVGDADLLVTRMADGRVVAFAADCPHQATPLEGATFFEGKLRCGRHLYLYDLTTGENVLPARDASPEALRRLKPGYLPVHRVEERDGWIWVAEEPEPAPACFDPDAERPLPPGVAVPAAPAAPQAAPSGPASGPLEHPTESREVRVGEEFELVLATSPRPAHMWRSAVLAAGVAVVSEGFAPDQPPRHVARLVAQAPGEVEVRFTYATPWDPKPVEIRTFLVRVAP